MWNSTRPGFTAPSSQDFFVQFEPVKEMVKLRITGKVYTPEEIAQSPSLSQEAAAGKSSGTGRIPRSPPLSMDTDPALEFSPRHRNPAGIPSAMSISPGPMGCILYRG